MKRFISHLLILLISLTISSELIVRLFNLAQTPLNRIKKESITLFAPNQSGTMVFGNLGDIRAEFQINPQGFNSVYDYEELFIGRKYAIIGDSFVEGFHENVHNSIGRRIENIMANTRVHEYGRSGWNAHNYLQLCDMLAEQYNQVFVICETADFIEDVPANHTVENSWVKQIFTKSRLLCYLYYNRKVTRIFKNERPEIPDVVKNKSLYEKIALSQKMFPDNVIWVWRDREAEALLNDSNIMVKHKLTPFNYGLLDGHWNSNGRQNAAETIVAFLEAKGQNKNKTEYQ